MAVLQEIEADGGPNPLGGYLRPFSFFFYLLPLTTMNKTFPGGTSSTNTHWLKQVKELP